MEFKNNITIYLQIAHRLCDEILQGAYTEDERIPSVREYSAIIQVNVNTTVRSYDYLQQLNIIYNKRGLGYFVSQGAITTIQNIRRQEFLNHQLPDLFHQMRMLNISIDDIIQHYKNSISEGNT